MRWSTTYLFVLVILGVAEAHGQSERKPTSAPPIPSASSELLFRPVEERTPTRIRTEQAEGPAWNDATPFESALDNFSLFAGLEASRQPQDLGVNANFGGNLSANIGMPLLEDLGLGLQAGIGLNLSKAGVRVLRVAEGTRSRVQWFGTIGVFERADSWYAGIAYDHQESSYYSQIQAGQIRSEVGFDVSPDDVVGAWGAVAVAGTDVSILAADLRIRPMNQLSIFWNHRWESGAETRFWLGVAGQHGTDIISLPDRNLTDPVAVFGLQVFVPLNNHFAMFGQGNFVTPSDTGTLDAYLGLAYFFGGTQESRTNRFAPVLPVANNPTMPLDLRRR